MPISVRPSMSPDRELELTAVLTAAVAHELWKHCGGNEVVNWLEAELFVASLAVMRRSSRGARHAPDRSAPHPRAPRRPDPERPTGPLPIQGAALTRAAPD